MIKRIRHILPALVVAAIGLAACDNISEDERLIYVKPAAVQRAVLIEDFTGQRCVNCPKATDAIHQLQEQYGDSVVIAVGIHSGPFSKSATGTPYPLYTADGDEYYSHWGVVEQPSGMVNRTSVSAYTTWGTQVYEQIQLTAPVSILLEARVDADSRKLRVDTRLMAVDGAVAGKLQLWLVEDSIVSPQYMPDGSAQRDYVHNHVYRCAINGTWGEDVAMAEGETASRSNSITFSESYDISHLSIVAFVYNSTGVLQVTRQRLDAATRE